MGKRSNRLRRRGIVGTAGFLRTCRVQTQSCYKTPRFLLNLHRQPDNIDGWGDPALWEQANKIKTNHFNGAYVELGYKFFGNAYSYDKFNGVMNGLSGKSLEIVGRFNYTGLNDLTEGEYYSAGRDQYYAAGFLQDFPGIGATSVGGGDIYSTTIGLNYAFNKYAQVMLDYTWHRVNIDRLPHDKNVHAVQARVQFTF